MLTKGFGSIVCRVPVWEKEETVKALLAKGFSYTVFPAQTENILEFTVFVQGTIYFDPLHSSTLYPG